MGLSETKSAIQEIVDATKDYQLSINNIQKDLLSLGEEINSNAVAIATEINAPQVVQSCLSYTVQTIAAINNSLEQTREALNTLSKDATEKVKELVDNYNNSLDQESREPRLSYITISLTSIAGTVSCSVTTSGVKRPSGSSGPSGDYPSYPDTPEDTTPETFDFSYYLDLLGTTGVYSKDIPNWDEEMKKFFEENELDQYIKKIELDGNIIKLTLSNDKEVELNDIKDKDEFIEKVKEVLKEEGLME